MLGLVMNCFENVFIHDGRGHLIYFQTFHGHSDLGKHALGMLMKLTELLDSSEAHAFVKRIPKKINRRVSQRFIIFLCVSLCSLLFSESS
jgi:hypothetical protein